MKGSLLLASGLFAGLLGNALSPPASAAQPTIENSGYYRLRMGDFEITALADGTLRSPTENQSTPVNGYLVNTGKNLVLIDTGAGTLLGPGVGRLLDNLRAAGYQPEQIDEVYLTHVSPDHVGGLLMNRKAAFPHAIVRVSRSATDYWTAKSTMAAAPAEERQHFAEAAAAFKPYIAAGHFEPFDGKAEFVQGIRALPNPMGAAGDTVYVVESRGNQIVFWGDTLAVTADAAIAQHLPLANAGRARSWAAATHLSFPGIGHLRAAGHGYRLTTDGTTPALTEAAIPPRL